LEVGLRQLTNFIVGAWMLATLSHAASILDTGFNPGSGAGGGIVEQALPQPDGKILVCGNFTSFNGQNRGYVARLNSDGSVDQGFLAQPSYWVRHMALQGDGKIVIGGYFKQVAGAPRSLIARLNSNGSLDPSFDPGSGATNIIAGGVDGNIDPFIFWLAVQPDGKIVITGNFRNYNGVSSTGIARLNSDGSLDRSFNVGPGFDSWGRHILLLSNGQMLVSGWFTSYNGHNANRMVRINADGSADTSFNPFFGDSTAVYSSAVTADGRIIATGHSINLEALFHEEMRRLNWDGTVDASFTANTNDKTESTLIQPDGKIIVAGSFTYANGTPRTSIARFNADGSLDPSFAASIDNFVWGMAFQPDGKLLVAGGFKTVDGAPRGGVARLLTGVAGAGGPITVPDVAPQLSIASVTGSSITLNWSDSSSQRSGYTLEQRTSSGFSTVANLAATLRGYTLSGLPAGSTYSLRLRANNVGGTSIYSSEVSASTTAATPVPPVSGGGTSANAAVFVGADSSTAGSWKGKYGGDGYAVFEDSSNPPAYVRVTPLGKSDWTWQDSTPQPPALQRTTTSARIAACWYSATSFTIDLVFTDAQPHQVAAYFLDWDAKGRRALVEVTDGATGLILDSRTVTSFTGGTYLVWNLSGHVKISITNQGPENAVMSGLFFGSAGGTAIGGGGSTTPPPSDSGGNTDSPSAKASFAGINSTTKGSWRGLLANDGAAIPMLPFKLPGYAQPSVADAGLWTWSTWTSDVRGMQYPFDARKRMASCWFGGAFTIDLGITDAQTHRVSLYVCDWDSTARAERIEFLDAATGTVLSTQNVADFNGGEYLSWDVKGTVKVRVTRTGGANAVVNGVLFEPSPVQL
jgi:uncharacterized delta-60 repeat protein